MLYFQGIEIRELGVQTVVQYAPINLISFRIQYSIDHIDHNSAICAYKSNSFSLFVFFLTLFTLTIVENFLGLSWLVLVIQISL